ncbi:MAG: polysaccharide deacetylase family protein [Dehalococcoidia bacterium]
MLSVAVNVKVTRRRALLLGTGLFAAGAAGGMKAWSRDGGTRLATSESPRYVSMDLTTTERTPLPAGAANTATSTSRPLPSPTPTRTPAPPPPDWSAEDLRQPIAWGSTERPLVGLTIDDGWSCRDEVLEVLQARKVQPTFFLTGRAIVGDYGFIARALDAGCEIGNHTMDHYNLTDKSSAYIRKDLEDFEQLVKSVVGLGSTRPFMRPSGGDVNATINAASAEAGYRPVLWSVSSGDGSASTTADGMTRNILANARPGAIVLMHFGPRAVDALPGIIDGLRSQGLEPVSLSRLFSPA